MRVDASASASGREMPAGDFRKLSAKEQSRFLRGAPDPITRAAFGQLTNRQKLDFAKSGGELI